MKLQQTTLFFNRHGFGTAIAPLIGIFILLFGSATLAGWMVGSVDLARFIHGLPLMVPNTAVAFILAAIALFLRAFRRTSRITHLILSIVCLGILAISIASIIEFVTGESLAFNSIFFELLGTRKMQLLEGQPSGPSPNTAIAFALLALSFLTAETKVVVSQVLTLLAFSIAALALVGQAYQISFLFRAGSVSPLGGMALPTALGLIFLCIGVLSTQRDQGIILHFESDSPTGVLFRRFSIGMLFAPLLFGVAAFIGSGKSPGELILVHTGVSMVILGGFAAIVGSAMRTMTTMENTRKKTEETLKQKESALAEAQRIAQVGSWEWEIPNDKFSWSNEVYRILDIPTTLPLFNLNDFLSLIHASDRQAVENTINDSITNKTPYFCEHRVVFPGKDVIYVQCRGEINFAADGTALRMIGTIQNISSRKQIELALQRKEKLLTAVIAALPVGVWLMDSTGFIYSGNEAGNRIWTGAKYVGLDNFGVYKGWWEDTGKEIRPEDWAGARAIRNGQTSIGELIRIQCFDGSQKIILNSAIPLRNEQGGIEGAIIVNEDITERRLAQLEAEAAEKRIRAFLENASDSVITTDAEGKIIFANKQAETWFGYGQNELIGQSISILFPERFREMYQEQTNRYIFNPKTRLVGAERDLVARRKDGSEFPVEISITPVALPTGTNLTVVVRDVTERKRLENQQHFLSAVSQELAESIDFQATLERAASLAVPELADWCLIYELDQNKNSKLRIIKHFDPDQNSVLEEALGSVNAKRFLHSAVLRVVRSGQSQIVPLITKSATTDILANPEISTGLKELGVRSYMISPLKAHGQIMGVVVLVYDNSGRRYSYQDRGIVEDLAQRIALAMTNAKLYTSAVTAVRDREDVLSVVSHDLKNPLAAIRISAAILNRRLNKLQIDNGLTNMVESIDRNVTTMTDLISNILDVGKIQEGTFLIEPKQVEFNSILEPVKELFRQLAADRNIELVFEPEDLDFRMICDKHRLIQLFSNLIGNAIKFTPEGGRVTVTMTHQNHELATCVEDNGPGIPAEQISHVFERYWQAKKSSTQGSGLGLYICKGIVRAHGGRIWAESKPGFGSRFCFVIPDIVPEIGVSDVTGRAV